MTEQDKLIKAKIPCDLTGIKIKKTMCDICTPGPQCGIDAYVKDGVVIKVEGTKGFPSNNGKLCTKGASNREYIYRKDRLKYPMKRVGERGSGQYERITWDEALDICAEKLLELKGKYGAEAVAWMTGYSKWFRPWLHRLTHSFGSLNYITESSACHRAEVMSYKAVYGQLMLPDMRFVKTVICWGSNPFVNAYLRGKGIYALKERGGKVVCIDPRMTQTAQKVSDLYLRPRIGTDGVLANTVANCIIQRNAVDMDFIQKYVHGYDAYKEMVSKYTLEMAEEICGIPKEKIEQFIDIFLENEATVIMPGNGLTHRVNGFNLHRAVISLMAIVGRIDKPGTFLPAHETFCHSDGGFDSREEAFYNETRPMDCKPAIGQQRFPIWHEFVDEAQGMDFVRQVNEKTPYELKGAVCFGVNHMMYPQSSKFLEALDKLEFVVATDIFETEVCHHADIVLPVRTSFERSEAKCYAGRFVNFTLPAIAPVSENYDDVWVMAELAKRMKLGDTLLEDGYDAGIKYMFSESGITDWEAVKAAELPVVAPNAKPYQMGSFLANPLHTPTGKIELYSEVIAKYKTQGYNPLPEVENGFGDIDRNEYPLTMMSGARIPTAIHTRTTQSSWLRSISEQPMLEINREDALKLHIKDGDLVKVSTPVAQIILHAKIDETFAPGEIGMFHGFKEANANELIPMNHLDKYSGFPGYKQFGCKVEKVEEA